MPYRHAAELEKKNDIYETFIRRFFTAAAVLLLLAAGLVFLFDPFFHYHEPLGPLKAVLTKKEYQVPGTLKNFAYDSVIAGSSTAENFNNRWFDEAFDTRSVKAIKSSGVTAQLDYYIRMATEKRTLDYVFYSLDLFALSGDPDTEFPDESMPLYLYDENPFTDVNYLLNRDVIFEDIPYLLAETFLDDYDEGASYNWAQYHSFSRKAPGEIAGKDGGGVPPLYRRKCGHPGTDGAGESGYGFLYFLSSLFPALVGQYDLERAAGPEPVCGESLHGTPSPL